jgi:thiamine-monophosphate kinase
MLGEIKKNKLVLRNGARRGDAILVTGSLGGSIRGKHLTFTPRLKEAHFLAEKFRVHAMIDISDGLVQDLRHILDQSKAGARIYKELIPVSRQARDLEDALYSGEDFELLFTMSRSDAERLLEIAPKRFKLIGEIVDKASGLKLIDKHNRVTGLNHKGYRHF